MAFHPAPNLRLPPPLDGYTLIDRLGRGGFGEVWKCEAPGGFLKAVKFVYGDLDSSEEGRPAEQELKSLNRVKDIRHPYILTLERYDIIEGQLMVMMELAERNLWDRFRECRMLGQRGIPRDELLRYLSETAEALDLMNDKYKLQHLDIKPQNLFLVYDHVKVADFGLAKAFEGSVGAVTGGVTPVYAAPETFQSQVTRFSDQYSLGIVFQELLTGVRPFNGQNTKQLLMQHLRDLPDLLSLPEYDRAIIGRSLEKDPNKRWPNCKEFVQRLVAAPSTEAHLHSGAIPLPSDTPVPQQLAEAKVLAVAAPNQTVNATALNEARESIINTQLAGAPPSSRVIAPISPAPNRGFAPGSTFGSALPSLVTPKMAGPRVPSSHAAATLNAIHGRNAVVETGRMGAMGIAPPPVQGEGVLMPALIVGLGRSGLDVIRQFRRMVKNRFGSLDTVKHTRFLHLDTDPETSNAALTGDDPLAPHQAVLARLNRPAHYLQRDGLPPVEQWLPPNTLYKLPKTPGPASGVRSFGRLALCDNYRLIAQRVKNEIEAILSDEFLKTAAASTELGLRSNAPRVYIVASLGGGTGSGMFLDLAYLIKHELRSVGYRNPEVHGLFLAPAADKSTPRLALANCFAALAELNHYGTQRYQNRFDTNDAPIQDANPPFERTGLVLWPRSVKGDEGTNAIGGLARSLYLDLFTPAGERIDYIRAAAPVDKYSGPTLQPFGVYRLSWPRYELLSALTRRFSQLILRQWTGKEATHLKEPIRYWLDEQWASYKLDPKSLLARLEAGVKESLRGDPGAAFDAAVESSCGPGNAKVDGNSAVRALDQLIKLVGKPEIEQSSGVPAIGQIVDELAKVIIREAESNLSAVAVTFIEQSQYRLAGAEEALAQITDLFNEAIEKVEVDYKRYSNESIQSFGRLFPVIGSLAGGSFGFVGRRASLTGELLEILAAYPRQRYRVLVLGAILSVLRKLRDGIPESNRDIHYCRVRLAEISDGFGTTPANAGAAEPGAFVLPVGCPDLNSAADEFVAALPAEDILQFDQKLQAEIAKKYRGLVSVCLRSNRGPQFAELLGNAAREFLDSRLEKANPAEALERYRGSGEDCLSVLETAYEGAAPSIQPLEKPEVEATILAAPDGPAGERLRHLAQEANPDVQFIPAPLADEVVIYREFPRVPIGALAQMGALGQQAYLANAGSETPPHTRSDIEWVAVMRPTAVGIA